MTARRPSTGPKQLARSAELLELEFCLEGDRSVGERLGSQYFQRWMRTRKFGTAALQMTIESGGHVKRDAHIRHAVLAGK